MIAKNHICAYNYPIAFLIEEYDRAIKIAEKQAWVDVTMMQMAIASCFSDKAGKEMQRKINEVMKDE